MSGKGYALARAELIRVLTAYSGVTTADGLPGGTTLVDANLKDNPSISAHAIPEKTILIMSGDAIMEDKGAASFANATGTITLQGAGFSAQIKKGTLFRILNISSVEIDVADIGTKIGTNTDAPGTTTLFAWLAKIFDAADVAAIEAKLDHASHGLAALKALIDAIEAKLDGASGLAALKAVIDAILVDTSTTLEGKLDAIPTTAMRGTDNALLAAAYTAPDNAGIATLLTRITAAVALASALTTHDTDIKALLATIAGYIDAEVAAIETKLDAQKGATGIFYEQAGAAINESVDNTEHFVVALITANTRYILRNLRLKSADPGAGNSITVKLYELIDGEVNVDSFIITQANFGTYFSLMDMFGLPHIAGDSIKVSLTGALAGPIVVTGQYSHGKTNV